MRTQKLIGEAARSVAVVCYGNWIHVSVSLSLFVVLYRMSHSAISNANSWNSVGICVYVITISPMMSQTCVCFYTWCVRLRFHIIYIGWKRRFFFFFFWVSLLCWWARDAPVYGQSERCEKKTHTKIGKRIFKTRRISRYNRIYFDISYNCSRFHGWKKLYPFNVQISMWHSHLIEPVNSCNFLCTIVIHAIITMALKVLSRTAPYSKIEWDKWIRSEIHTQEKCVYFCVLFFFIYIHSL